LNHIDNELRAERNRYIHDQWTTVDENIVRRKHGVKVVRPQARQLTVLKSIDRTYGSVSEVSKFAEKLAGALDDLISVNGELDDLYLEIWPPEENF
jgi:hypothetical protein